ncbi:MAG TPA: hypothetical protein VFD92_24640 [Candidatus Binatia bacterium]|nr:hypothetical protein [Candidatus Binatia bacterium]
MTPLFRSVRAAALGAVVASAALLARESAACSCVPESLASQYERATDVFVATASEGPVTPPGDQAPPDGGTTAVSTRQVRWVLEVGESFKGGAAKKLEVATPSGAAACGVTFEKGQTYLVFARRDTAKAALQTDLCMGNVSGEKLDAAVAEVRRLSSAAAQPVEGSKSP